MNVYGGLSVGEPVREVGRKERILGDEEDGSMLYIHIKTV
jgi:hypothetical protein